MAQPSLQYDYRAPLGYVVVTSGVLFVIASICYSSSFDYDTTLVFFRFIELGGGRTATAMFVAAVLLTIVGLGRILLLTNRFGLASEVTLGNGELLFPEYGLISTKCRTVELSELKTLNVADAGPGRRLTITTSDRDYQFDSLWFAEETKFDDFASALAQQCGLEIKTDG